MSTITAITRQKRNPDRVSVFLDGEFALGLASEAAAGLAVGQELSATDIESLEAAEDLVRARDLALNFLSYRPRSRYEIEQRLRRKEYPTPVVDQVLGKLEAAGLLDDGAFAAYWVEQRETFKPRGIYALRQELRQKGVARQDMEPALSTVDETASASKAALQRLSHWQRFSEEEFRRKLTGYLQRRGFRYETIREIADDVWQQVLETRSSAANPRPNGER